MIEHSVQVDDDKTSVKIFVYCDTDAFSGFFPMLLSAAINHDSTLFNTIIGDDRGEKGAADAGNRAVGMVISMYRDSEGEVPRDGNSLTS
jgi:hypothetical protein